MTERLKRRLAKDRPMASVTVRVPVDVIDSMKEIAPQRGVAGCQTLLKLKLKLYLSEGLRRDEVQFSRSTPKARLIEALKKQGVSDEELAAAEREAA